MVYYDKHKLSSLAGLMRLFYTVAILIEMQLLHSAKNFLIITGNSENKELIVLGETKSSILCDQKDVFV